MYLTTEELKGPIAALLDEYYDLLAAGLVNRWGEPFWNYHRKIFREAGIPMYGTGLAKAVVRKLADLALNPKDTVGKVLRKFRSQDKAESEALFSKTETKVGPL
jgi:hypothetical protein